MRKKIILSFLSIGMLWMASCAVIFDGTSDKVNFTSEPVGSEVWINGEYRGDTPLLNLKLRSNKEYTVEIKKAGFVTHRTTITNGVAAGYIVLDVLFTGLVGVVIDAATGAYFTLDETDISATLKADTSPTPSK